MRCGTILTLFNGTDVFKNIEAIDYAPLFHRIVSCALPENGGLDCKEKAVPGNSSRQKYVSTEAVYLASASKVYALNLKDLAVRAHAFTELPLDQFSFKELNGNLHVLGQKSDPVTGTDEGSAPETTGLALAPGSGAREISEAAQCVLSLFRLPITAFDSRGLQAEDWKPTTWGLPSKARVGH
ncbi:MAG TPA: hypothetical protein VE954_12400 [Oligoflexus sp.]|uniref:hypothetical protein n=1 Tax=Oligoflexus sp. TaxID=1971216 RepID=UPI002D6F147D|nr:hypothetical protein [Oligoflexus sp.]HYX33908.1 hypothetical protein [Oligoflexus sp.]